MNDRSPARYLLIAALLILGMAYLYWNSHYSASARREQALVATLSEFQQVVATGDASAILAFLDTHIDPEARIALSVTHGIIAQALEGHPTRQVYDKPGFLAFLADKLSRTSAYSLSYQLQRVDFGSARDVAAVRLTGRATADGMLQTAGIPGHFVLQLECSAGALFSQQAEKIDTRLTKAECAVNAQALTKSDRASLEGIKAMVNEARP